MCSSHCKVGTHVETESERTCTRHLPEDEIYCRNSPIWKNAYTQALPPAFPLPINKSISLLPSSPLPHSSLHHILSSTLLYLYPVVHPSFSPYLFAHQIPTVLFIWVCTRYLLGSNDTGGILIGRPRVNSIGVTTHIQSWNGPHNDRSSAPTVTGLLHVTLICVQPLSSVLP